MGRPRKYYNVPTLDPNRLQHKILTTGDFTDDERHFLLAIFIHRFGLLTFCNAGHRRTKENTHKDKDGYLRCRECAALRGRKVFAAEAVNA